jgi:hypothetical protein
VTIRTFPQNKKYDKGFENIYGKKEEKNEDRKESEPQDSNDSDVASVPDAAETGGVEDSGC